MGAEVSGGLALVHLFLEPLPNCRAAERLVSGQGALKAEKVAAETLYIALSRALIAHHPAASNSLAPRLKIRTITGGVIELHIVVHQFAAIQC